MKVSLIDFTGRGASDPARYAAQLLIYAKNTRLTQGEELLNRIEKMGPNELKEQLKAIAMSVRSSWEFVSYTWQIEGVTRAFTHQFVRSRHASFAQQAMRVANMSTFETLMPETVRAKGPAAMDVWVFTTEAIRGGYSRLLELGIPAQDARGLLPTNVLTNIVASFNLRALADLVGKRDNPRAQDEYSAVLSKMVRTAQEVHPWLYTFLYPDRTSTPALDALLKEKLNGRSPVDLPEVNQALKELDQLRGVWG